MHHEKYLKFFHIHMKFKKENEAKFTNSNFHSFSAVYKAVKPKSLALSNNPKFIRETKWFVTHILFI